ncbi:MAG TPA: glycosyltransferase [Gemmatirosa sp.]
MRRILVITNIPTPYNDALFASLTRQPGVNLRVVYGAAIEADRAWRLAADKAYAYDVLPGWTLGGSAHLNPRVVRAVRSFRPDIAVLSGSYVMPTVQIAAAALRARGTPWLYWGEELAHGPAPATVRSGRAVLRRALLRARGVLAIGSRACVSYARAGVATERVADFRYYADTDRFALEPDARMAARRAVRGECRIPDEAFVVVYGGQLIARKGVDTLLHAVARLQRDANGTRAAVLLAGDGPEGPALAALAEDLGIRDRVHFMGFQQPEALPAVFAAADAFVLPSHAEGWGVVVPEAMAAGLPVFASDRVNSAVDLVRDGENGAQFAAGDAARLAALLRVAAEQPDHRCAMAEAARAAVRCETPAFAARRLVSLLDAATARRPLLGL